LNRAHERITRRKPIARTWRLLAGLGEGRKRGTRGEYWDVNGEDQVAQSEKLTKDSEMMVLRPAAILAVDRGTLASCSW
jgi:hypothetical protein